MRPDIARKLTRGIAALFLMGLSTHLLLLDGLDGFLWSLIYRPSTRFAPGYSWLAFSRVQPGMSRDEVVKLLGEPMEVHDRPNQGTSWRYSKSPTDSHYSLRVVVFSNSGVVMRVAHEYYVD